MDVARALTPASDLEPPAPAAETVAPRPEDIGRVTPMMEQYVEIKAANPDAPASPFPSTEGLAKLHGPVLFINGGEVDFMYGPSRANFELVTLPAFYGARDNAGHTATVYHPGGGEFANVASNWLKYQFKSDAVAGKTFVGSNCELCTNPNWETASKNLK